jgi:hypothetical protein
MSIGPAHSLPPNKPLEWTGHHQQSAAPPHAPCLPLRDSVDAGPVAADLNGVAAVALRWRHEPDAATQLQASATLWNGLRGSPVGI